MVFDILGRLLSDISKEIEIQHRLPKQFNVFELTEVRHYETRHSAILAGILGWKGSRKPLCQFLKMFLPEESFSDEQLKNASVFTEYAIYINNEQRRLDILIKIGDDVFVVIENKIYTEDHSMQLEAYRSWLDTLQHHTKRYLIYLTLDGRKSSENFSDDKYICLSYKKDIRDFLVNSAALTNIDTRFNSTLLQYTEFWENWFMQSEELNEKIREKILASKENYQAAEQVFLAFKDAKHQLIKNLLQSWQDRKASEFLPCDKANDMIGKFWEKMSFTWNDNYIFGFEFSANYFTNLCYGVIGKEAVQDWQSTFDGWGKSPPWWPAYKFIQNDKIRHLGDNSEICISEADEIFRVLDEAFYETVRLLNEHQEYFGSKH